eukprot:1799247-Ditylum_brightwellii.AAC.1
MVAVDIHKNNTPSMDIDSDDNMLELVDRSNGMDSDDSNFDNEHKDSDDEIKVKVLKFPKIARLYSTRIRKDSVQWSQGKIWSKLLEDLKMARILGGCHSIMSEKKTGVFKINKLELLVDCIISHDQSCNGLSRKECITTVSALVGCSMNESKKCYSYYMEKDYLPYNAGGVEEDKNRKEMENR